MRLIDADALKQERVYIDDIPVVTEHDIDDAPTIDAIPMEWLKKVRKDASEVDSLDVGIAEVLDMWEKKQEAR